MVNILGYNPILKMIVMIYHISQLLWFGITYSPMVTAPLMPLRLYSVSPEVIHWERGSSRSIWEPLDDGDWDQNLRKFNNNIVHQSFIEHFENNKSWTETKLYEFQVKHNRSGLDVLGYINGSIESESNVSIQEALQEYDRLFNNINKNGYKKQKEMYPSGVPSVPLGQPSSTFPEFEEITVDITRDGEFVLVRGQHRLSMAKISDNINIIPIRIRCRHREWQEIRDGFVTDEETNSNFHAHVDIQPLINNDYNQFPRHFFNNLVRLQRSR
jgi:hypothetical protein